MAVEPVRGSDAGARRCPIGRCPHSLDAGDFMCPTHMERIPRWERARLRFTARPPYGVGHPKHNEATWLALVAVYDQED